MNLQNLSNFPPVNSSINQLSTMLRIYLRPVIYLLSSTYLLRLIEEKLLIIFNYQDVQVLLKIWLFAKRITNKSVTRIPMINKYEKKSTFL